MEDIIKAVFVAFSRTQGWKNHGDAAEAIRSGKVHYIARDQDWGDTVGGRPRLAQMGERVDAGDWLYLTVPEPREEGGFWPDGRNIAAEVAWPNEA